MPMKILKRIREKFHKTDKARTREYGGNGTEIAHKGWLWIQWGRKIGVRNVSDGVEFGLILIVNHNMI